MDQIIEQYKSKRIEELKNFIKETVDLIVILEGDDDFDGVAENKILLNELKTLLENRKKDNEEPSQEKSNKKLSGLKKDIQESKNKLKQYTEQKRNKKANEEKTKLGRLEYQLVILNTINETNENITHYEEQNSGKRGSEEKVKLERLERQIDILNEIEEAVANMLELEKKKKEEEVTTEKEKIQKLESELNILDLKNKILEYEKKKDMENAQKEKTKLQNLENLKSFGKKQNEPEKVSEDSKEERKDWKEKKNEPISELKCLQREIEEAFQNKMLVEEEITNKKKVIEEIQDLEAKKNKSRKVLLQLNLLKELHDKILRMELLQEKMDNISSESICKDFDNISLNFAQEMTKHNISSIIENSGPIIFLKLQKIKNKLSSMSEMSNDQMIAEIKNIFPKTSSITTKISTDYTSAQFFQKFEECMIDVENHISKIHERYKGKLDSEFWLCLKMLFKFELSDYEKSIFYLIDLLQKQGKFTEFYLISSQIISLFFNPFHLSFIYLTNISEILKITPASHLSPNWFPKQISLPKILTGCIHNILANNFSPFSKIITGINKNIKETQFEEFRKSLEESTFFLLPMSLDIAGFTDYSGRIYINFQFEEVILQANQKTLQELNENDFYLLVCLIHEYGHKIKLLASKTLDSLLNKADPFISSPKECMLFFEDSKTTELFPEAGGFVEIEIFGSVIQEAQQLASIDGSKSAEQNAHSLFLKMEKNEKLDMQLLKQMKIQISMNKLLSLNNPRAVRHMMPPLF